MRKAQLALASAVTALLIIAGTVVAARTSSTAGPLAFLAGGRVTQPAANAAALSAAPAPASLGTRALPFSSPVSIDAALAATGYTFPPGSAVYAAKITKEDGGLAYEDFEGAGGALYKDFWPASSIKVLAAVGALEFLGQQGFSGAATVQFGGGAPRTVKSIYDAAIRVSSNADYDLLVQIAGVDWLNQEFLTPARGFPATVIQRSYTVGGLLRSPAMTLTEGTKKVTIPARGTKGDPSCKRDQCSNLYEMSESVRRVVLNDEIPEAERFRLNPADVSGLTAALLAAEGWFEPAVAKVLGASTRIYGKPGEVPRLDCLDITLLDNRKGQRLLLSATVPESQGGCAALVTLATAVLKLLTG